MSNIELDIVTDQDVSMPYYELHEGTCGPVIERVSFWLFHEHFEFKFRYVTGVTSVKLPGFEELEIMNMFLPRHDKNGYDVRVRRANLVRFALENLNEYFKLAEEDSQKYAGKSWCNSD